jgi:Na+-translocating ferredoxin:NAD+ oxidoreductase RnfC subunit
MSQQIQPENDLISMVRDAGVVGEGGAGFPAHVKYDARVDIVIANGCECEPLLYSDQHIMQHNPEQIVLAMQEVMKVTGAARGVIAIKEKYTLIAEGLEAAMKGTGLELAKLDNFYPAGDEQILIHEITGKTVPPLGLPKDQGIVVANVGSFYSVANAMDKIPMTTKVVTVTGEVNHPSVIKVPVGTSIKECIEHCGGFAIPDPVVVIGGPMMGRIIDDPKDIDTEVVTKTCGGLIVLPREHFLHQAATLSTEVIQKRAANACIQCRMCTDMCPRYLVGHGFETHRVMRVFAGAFGQDQQQAVDASQAMMCCECGVCELFACPMGLSPRRVNAFLKLKFRQENVQYEGPKEVKPGQTEFREYRRVPTPRLAMKIGIAKYLDLHPEFEGEYLPGQVRIPLQQHIGAPSIPLVSTGDKVTVGQCIADIPEGKLGARIHASICGEVTTIDRSSITIKGN